jgi:disulfide bond formation protein DsbB
MQPVPDDVARRIYAKVANDMMAMSPEQRRQFLAAAEQKYKALPAKYKMVANQYIVRLANHDGREATGLGVIGGATAAVQTANWAERIASVVQAVTAVAGIAMAYKGMQDDKQAKRDAQENERQAIAAQTEQTRAMLAAQQQQREAVTAKLDAKAAAPGLSSTAWMLIGGGALAVVGVVVMLAKKGKAA